MWRPSIVISDQDGDGIFERLDVFGNPALPDWAKPFARTNRKVRGVGANKRTPFTPEMIMPNVRVVLAKHD